MSERYDLIQIIYDRKTLSDTLFTTYKYRLTLQTREYRYKSYIAEN